MSRKWIAAAALLACTALVAFAPLRQQGAPKPPAAAPTAPAAAQTGLWVVMLETSKWDATKTPQEQVGFMDHMKHVNQMATDGTLMVGGPLLEGHDSFKVTGAMMVVKAENADAVKKLLAADGFIVNDVMKIASVRAFFPGAGQWTSHAAAPGAPGAPAGQKQ